MIHTQCYQGPFFRPYKPSQPPKAKKIMVILKYPLIKNQQIIKKNKNLRDLLDLSAHLSNFPSLCFLSILGKIRGRRWRARKKRLLGFSGTKQPLSRKRSSFLHSPSLFSLSLPPGSSELWRERWARPLIQSIDGSRIEIGRFKVQTVCVFLIRFLVRMGFFFR